MTNNEWIIAIFPLSSIRSACTLFLQRFTLAHLGFNLHSVHKKWFSREKERSENYFIIDYSIE